MLARALTPVLAAFALRVAGACDAGLRERSGTTAAPGGTSNQVVADVGTSSLLQRMMDAPATIVLQGIRRFETHWEVAGQQQHLVYREELSCDGQGGFAVDPIETINPSLGGGPESLFFVLQKAREGFMFQHRDFMVRDLDLFFSRYQALDLGVTTNVAGRECAQLDVQLQQGAESVWHLALDLETGMLLRVREESLVDGSLIALAEFESIKDVPDFTGKVFHQPLHKETRLDKMTTPQLFVAPQPKLVPQGYQLLETSVIQEALSQRNWVRYTYSDGLQELFFLYTGEEELVDPSLGTVPGGQVPPPGPRTDEVTVIEVGPWNVVQGTVFDGEVVVMGIASVTELLDMIESAFN